MTVRELKQLLKGLPNDMDVIMAMDDETFITVCKEQSSVVEFEASTDEGDEEEPETHIALLLLPCTCHVEKEVEIEEPNLN